MPRGVAHPPELRAQVLAAIIAGATINEASRRFDLDTGLVSRWASADAAVAATRAAHARTPEALEAMLFDLVAEHVTTIRAQLQAAASSAYVQGQTAGDLAALLGAERDTLIRLLAGFRPVEQQQPGSTLTTAELAESSPSSAADA
jgi:transposase-like protein